MFRYLFLFASVVMSLGATLKRGEAAAPLKAADYPTVSKRLAFFEERINAKNPTTRRQVLDEFSYSYSVPNADYVAFLKRLLSDSDPSIRSEALLRLYFLFVPIQAEELPRRFAVDYRFRQHIDLDDPTTIPTLMKECRRNSTQAGDAAYFLGLLRHKPAIPLLKKLTEQQDFLVCYPAARALLACGDPDSARPVFEEIVRSQLSLFVTPPTVPIKPANSFEQCAPATRSGKPPQPERAILACRALIELGPKDKLRALKKLITLLGYLEPFGDSNYQTDVRELLAVFSGEYFVSSVEAQKWYAAAYEKKDVVRARKAPPTITSADYPSVAACAAFFEDRINAKEPSIRRKPQN